MNPSYLIRPDALYPSESSDASAHLYIFMGGVHLLQTFSDVRHHPLEDLTAHYDSWAPHAEVLPRLQSQFTKLVPGSHASLSQEDRLTAVETA